MKHALIIGSHGQDGSYLYESLTRQEYRVLGIDVTTVRASFPEPPLPVDIQDPTALAALIRGFVPDEVYYLAAFHHSSEDALTDDAGLFRTSFAVHVTALVHVLEALKHHAPQARLFYAASSHVFGAPAITPQDETTPIAPICVYGITKAAGLQVCRFYRRQHGLFTSVGILYNHESPRRSIKFVSQKIVSAAIAIKNGTQRNLMLGDLAAQIDWGYAPDYVEAMQRMLQLQTPDDFVVASGALHTVRDFVEGVFRELDLDWKQYVVEDAQVVRKQAKRNLQGQAAKLQAATGWHPTTSFAQMIKLMVREGMTPHGR
jgi:GDPmannose 4,6-dehydratase